MSFITRSESIVSAIDDKNIVILGGSVADEISVFNIQTRRVTNTKTSFNQTNGTLSVP